MTTTATETDNFRMFDLIGNLVVVIQQDAAGAFHLIHLNSAYRARVGDLADDMIGPVAATFPARISESLCRNYTAALAATDPMILDELLSIAGTESWWRTTLTRDPDIPGRLIAVTVDITDLEGRAHSLNRTLAETHDSLMEVRTVAALIAHDTRAPLANVVSLVDLVLDGFSDLGNGKVALLNTCSDVATGALQAIEGLMARVGESGQRIRGRDRIDIGQVCREIASITDPTGRLDIDIADVTVVSDFVILQTTLRNLLDNAARYATSRIQVSVRQTEQDKLDLVVCDDGPGFSQGVDPLRSDKGITRIDGLRGYGMPAVAQLLRSCGGSLSHTTPRFGNGAALRVRIPGTLPQDAVLSRSA